MKNIKNLYHENTNLYFCYYIITAIMMCKLEHTYNGMI